MTWRTIPVTAMLALSLMGCSFHASGSWRAGKGNSNQSAGYEQPPPPSEPREPRRASGQVTRVTVRTRPPVDNETRPVPVVPPAPVSPAAPANPAPATATVPPATTPVAPAPSAVLPAVTPAPGSAASATSARAREERREHRQEMFGGQKPAAATTGQADTPSNTPEPAPDAGGVAPDKVSGEPHYSPVPPARRKRMGREQEKPGKVGTQRETSEKGDSASSNKADNSDRNKGSGNDAPKNDRRR